MGVDGGSTSDASQRRRERQPRFTIHDLRFTAFMKWKIAICVAAAVLLQSTLRVLLRNESAYADLPLVVVVYFALRLDPVQALLIASVAGLAADALGGGLLGAGGFSKTLTAFLIASLVTRIRIDNPLLRIPVLAGATLFDAAVYVALHRLPRPRPKKVLEWGRGTGAGGRTRPALTGPRPPAPDPFDL